MAKELQFIAATEFEVGTAFIGADRVEYIMSTSFNESWVDITTTSDPEFTFFVGSRTFQLSDQVLGVVEVE